MRRLRKLLIRNVNKNPNYLKKMRRDWAKALRQFDNVLVKIEKTNLRNLSDSQLFKVFDEFLVKYMEEFGIVMTVQDAFSMYSSEFLEPAFIKVLKNQNKLGQFTYYYTKLMSPVEDSFISIEKKSRLAILKEVKKSGFKSKKAQKMLKEHQKNFFWIRNNYAKQPVLDIGFFTNEIKSMIKDKVDPDKELKKMNDEIKDTIKEKKSMIKGLKLTKELVNLIRITENFSYIQDERKKYVLIANHYERLFMKEIARRKKLPIKLVEYLVYPETKQDKFDKQKLKKRVKSCVCIQDNKGFYIYEGSEVDKLHDKLFGKEKKKDITEVKGLCASKGKARGSVKIIQKTHDLINFKEGDILLSSMTRPEMVVAMKKAAAIVTDEGGITCHAAVVSRELRKPCIIATKIATKVLKDGDMVEVDADKGIVRKIK
jgi:phosphohistidine swiveling domain-containing protein